MNKSKTPKNSQKLSVRPWFQHTLQHLPSKLTTSAFKLPIQPPASGRAKLLYGILYFSAILTVVLAGFVVQKLLDRYVWMHRLVLVAGKNTGESYVLSKALEAVVKKYERNIEVIVIETDGTEENLNLLEGRLDTPNVSQNTRNQLKQVGAKYAELATAQADIVTDAVSQSSAVSARTIATLYQDTFQLVVNDPHIKNSSFYEFVERLKDTNRQEVIEVPLHGGQRISFLKIAKHFQLIENTHFRFTDTPDVESAFLDGKIDAVFRVRALNNKEVSDLVNSGGQMLSIEQGAAMQINEPAFQPDAKIPQGAYSGNPPKPTKELSTIAVQRLLLSRQDVPEWIIQEITQILNEHRQELAEAISRDRGEVKALVTNISEPRLAGSTGLTLHPGALSFYRRDEPPLIKKNADVIGLFLSIGTLVVSVGLELYRRFKRQRKDKADHYVNKVVALMELPASSQKPQGKPPNSQQDLKQLKDDLNQWINNLNELSQIFDQARGSLVNEEISQESFRTFNEAYKTARELIERKIEEKQREFSAYYVRRVLDLIKQQSSPDLRLIELERTLKEATELAQENVFSRESFRTFVDAYYLAKDVVEGGVRI